MEHVKRLYLVDEFDRVYKQFQRPSAAVAKTHSSIQLSRTLQDNQLSEDEKVRRYVAELHRYLNISDSHTPQQQLTVRKSRKGPSNVNTDRPVLEVTRPQPTRRPQLRSSVKPQQMPLPDETDDEGDDEVFVTVPKPSTSTAATTAAKAPKSKSLTDKSKRRKIDWTDWAAYKQ